MAQAHSKEETPTGSPGTLFACHTRRTRRWQGQGTAQANAGNELLPALCASQQYGRGRSGSVESLDYQLFIPIEVSRQKIQKILTRLQRPSQSVQLGRQGPWPTFLRHCNVPSTAYQIPWSERDRPAPDSGSKSMPPRLGSAIQTRQGVRRLLPDELAKGLGVLAEWGDPTAYPGSMLNYLPGIHTWEAIGRAISPLFEQRTEEPPSPLDDLPASSGSSAPRPPAERSTHMDDSVCHSEEGYFQWLKPDCPPGSKWRLARIYNLVDTCKSLLDRTQQSLVDCGKCGKTLKFGTHLVRE
jgi:hypothetical protein